MLIMTQHYAKHCLSLLCQVHRLMFWVHYGEMNDTETIVLSNSGSPHCRQTLYFVLFRDEIAWINRIQQFISTLNCEIT